MSRCAIRRRDRLRKGHQTERARLLALEPAVGDHHLHLFQWRRHLLCCDETNAANQDQKKHNHQNLDHGNSFQTLMSAMRQKRPRGLRPRAQQPLITLGRWTMMFTLDLNCD